MILIYYYLNQKQNKDNDMIFLLKILIYNKCIIISL